MFRRLLADFVRAGESRTDRAGASGVLEAAERLARAYSEAWSDVFLVSQLRLYRSWTPQERERKVQADSLRRAGATAFSFDTESALRIWAEAARLSGSIQDTSGVARALGNMGAALYAMGHADSASHHLTQAYDAATTAGDFLTAA
ncbi:MAG: hypothetical protein JSV95_03825, partial [Gemmatimonadota bacterium]